MAKSKAIIAKSYLYMMLLVLFIGILIYINVYGQMNIPLIFEIKPNNIEEDYFHFSDLPDLSSDISVYGEVSAVINGDWQNPYHVKTVLTDHKYAELYNLQLLGGSFYDRGIVKEKGHYVVISENLSHELFPFGNAVGQSLIIDDFSYNILGVYACDNSYWSKLSSDKYERIFIPYTTYPNYEQQMVTTLTLINDERTYSVNDDVKIKFPYYTYNSHEIDYKEKRNYSTQFISILLTFIQLIVVIYILKILYKMSRGYVEELIAYKDEYYFGELLIHKKKYLIVLALTLAVSTFLLIMVFKRVSIEIVMSGWFLPEDNLFDVSHYLDRIKAFFIYENSSKVIGDNFNYRLVNMTLFVSVILSLFIYPCFILFLSNFKRMIKTNYVIALELVAYLVFMLIVCVAINPYSLWLYFTSIITILLHFILLLVLFFINAIFDTSIKERLIS